MSDSLDFLEGLNEADTEFSQECTEQLAGSKVDRCRYDSDRRELLIEFVCGRRLFIDNIHEPDDITIGGDID